MHMLVNNLLIKYSRLTLSLSFSPVALVAENEDIRRLLLEMDVPVQTTTEVQPIEVLPASELSKAYQQLGMLEAVYPYQQTKTFSVFQFGLLVFPFCLPATFIS